MVSAGWQHRLSSKGRDALTNPSERRGVMKTKKGRKRGVKIEAPKQVNAEQVECLQAGCDLLVVWCTACPDVLWRKSTMYSHGNPQTRRC
jgi:hypothetical protein